MKLYLVLLPLIFSSFTAYAAESSFAVILARQAGLVGGAAQACGQDVSLLIARLDEAILAVAQDSMDHSNAVAAYQQSAKDTQALQAKKASLPCEQVLRDYQSLPLLRDDYKEVVLTALKADKEQQAKANTPPAKPTSPAAAPATPLPSTPPPQAPTTPPPAATPATPTAVPGGQLAPVATVPPPVPPQ